MWRLLLALSLSAPHKPDPKEHHPWQLIMLGLLAEVLRPTPSPAAKAEAPLSYPNSPLLPEHRPP